MNVGPLSKAKPRTWLATLRKRTAASRKALTKPAKAQANQSSNSSLSPEEKYCAICTPLGKLCPNEFPESQDWEDSEEEGNNQGKGEDNFSVCLDRDADLKEQDRKIKKQKTKMTMKKNTSK